jgi:transposase
MKYTTVGVDIAKNVFQLHWIDGESGEIVRKQIQRAVFLEHFANRESRSLKAFVTGNKNDAADARAIWMASQMPSKVVAVKTEAQQAVLALHRMRQQKIKYRTAQMN